MADVPGQRAKRLQPVPGRGRKADRACVLVILADRGDLADLKPESAALDERLRLEDEVVAVLEKWNRFKKAARVGAVAGVELRQVQAEHAILGRGQKAIPDALPPGTAGLGGVHAEPA